MIITSLKKLVEDYDINIVEVSIGEGVAPVSFEVSSPDYREQELFLVKGEYAIRNHEGMQILRVEKLEKELNIEINPYEVIADEAPVDPRIDEAFNTVVTALVFNRKTLDSAGREMQRKFVPNWAEAVLASFKANHGEATMEDFAVVEIDWDNRNVAIKSVALPVGDTMAEEQDRKEVTDVV